MPKPVPYRRPVGRPRKSEEERVPVNTRMPVQLHGRLRAHVQRRQRTDRRLSQNDVILELLAEALDRHDGGSQERRKVQHRFGGSD